jgi:hypothetical protein
MTKDEIKNRISMALKDPILQQGFEIICKNLDELEKENEKLKKRLSVLLSCKNCPDNKGGFICQKEYEDKCLTQKIQYIKEMKEENTELEKENAELKELLKEAVQLLKNSDELYGYQIRDFQLKCEQFTKESK